MASETEVKSALSKLRHANHKTSELEHVCVEAARRLRFIVQHSDIADDGSIEISPGVLIEMADMLENMLERVKEIKS